MGLGTFAARKSFEFMIYLWGAPDVEDLKVQAKALADAGFTVVDWDAAELDVLRKYGLKGMVKNPTEETVRQVASHPALWGYQPRRRVLPGRSVSSCRRRDARARADRSRPHRFRQYAVDHGRVPANLHESRRASDAELRLLPSGGGAAIATSKSSSSSVSKPFLPACRSEAASRSPPTPASSAATALILPTMPRSSAKASTPTSPTE